MKTNYYKQSALFLIEAFGPFEADKISIKYSKEAFLEGDFSRHFHWKFVTDQIEKYCGPLHNPALIDEDFKRSSPYT